MTRPDQMTAGDPRVHLFGIRHHGPGSARSLCSALDDLRPDAVLVEGPPEGNDLLPLVTSEAMQPPVALLVYSPANPILASYYPFAEFSPEWQALRFGVERGIPVRFIDLPQAHQMAVTPPAPPAEPVDPPPSADDATEDQPSEAGTAAERMISDPLQALAEAGGYGDSELWWEHMVEQRQNSDGMFGAVLEAMSAVRAAVPPETNPTALRREAAMRQAIRTALAEGFQRVAVVCGAWHTPSLTDLSDESGDDLLLSGLPETQLNATWIPWTYPRLARRSGYGAGILSPGWYHHLWETGSGRSRSDVATRWMINVARLLRGEDIDISPAHVIEAVRLAETLAALRERPLAGLAELNEAALTVYCFGNPVPMRLIEEQLIVGSRIGSVPPETPMAPLQVDFERETRRLRLTPEAAEKLLDFDLRKPAELDRSHLLHRLALIGVHWGQNDGAALQASARGRGGTFHEVWRLKWQPEFAIQLIEAGQWGNTIGAASSARVCHAADQAPDLVTLTGLVEDVLLAELPEAIQHVMSSLQAQAAVSSDTNHLMQALPPLVNVLRYGNVRQTDTEMIARVVDGLVVRICIGLLGACSALDDDAAGDMFTRIVAVDEAISRTANDDHRQQWERALAALAGRTNLPGILTGRACRILMDRGILSIDESARRLGLALSTASDPLQAAAWVEGFLRGSGQFLVHDDALLAIIDGWLAALPVDTFNHLLPLLRRTFATFSRPERRAIGERVRGQTRQKAVSDGSVDFDLARADAVLPLVRMLLGSDDRPQDRGE